MSGQVAPTRRERRSAGRAAARAQPAGRARRWSLALAIAAALAVAAAFGAGRLGGASTALAAGRTEHAFGPVRMQDGLLAVSFPLAVGETVYATDLGTT